VNIKPGDMIFLIKDETSMESEHIVVVDYYDPVTNIIKCSKVYTVHKILQQGGSVTYGLAPGFFIISNKTKDKNLAGNSDAGACWINLNNFDVIGHVTNEDVIKAFKERESKLVIPDISTTKAVLGHDSGI